MDFSGYKTAGDMNAPPKFDAFFDEQGTNSLAETE